VALEDALTSFENQTIRTVVIRNWDNESFLYTVFLRLNTGSVQLSPQELRQALHPGPFSKFVDDYSIESQLLRSVLKLKEPDFRMRDAELVIRYFAFRNFLNIYNGNLKPLLDETTRRFNGEWEANEDKIAEQVADFEMALHAAIGIFGRDHAFRKWNGTEYESQLNRAVFDALALSFSEQRVAERATAQREVVEGLFKELCSDDPDFRASIEGTTKSIESISTRIGIWGRALATRLRIPVTTAELRQGKIWLDHALP
jgi:hypothetical protein